MIHSLAIASDDQPPFAEYADNPVGFVHNILGIRILTTEQIQILESIRDNQETNVQAAHGVGKSFDSAIAVLYWVFAVGGLAITTAPTEDQVKQILWSEIRRMYDRNKHKLGGNRGELFLKYSESARAYGFTSRNYDSNSFQGKHAEKLLLIQDEACGITEEIDDGFQSCLTGSDNRGLRIGNPIKGGGPFEKACARTHIRIPVWNHPNVAWAYEKNSDGIHVLKAEVAIAILNHNGDVLPQSQWPKWCQRDVIPGAVSVAWIEKARKRGETSAFWQSRVEGLFPVDSQESIVPRSWFLAARQRYDENPDYWKNQAIVQSPRYGLDVGDGGDDHGMAKWQGPVLFSVEKMVTKGDREDVTRAAAWARRHLEEVNGAIFVDQIGVGAGALAVLIGQGYNANGVNWGLSNCDRAYQNVKAESYWLLREAFRTGEIAIAPLGELEDELMEDLAGTYYEETVTGKIRIEDKGKTRKRLHRSPNLGDAVVYAFGGGKQADAADLLAALC